jgi:hypothetical protein
MPAKGATVTEETRAKMRAAQKGRTFSDESRRKMSLAQKAKGSRGPHSQETRDKIGAAHRGRKHSPEQVEKNRKGHLGIPSARKGATHTEASNQKNRESQARNVHPRLRARGVTIEMVESAKANGMRWCAGGCKQFVPKDQFATDNPKLRLCMLCARDASRAVFANLTEEEKQIRYGNVTQWRIDNRLQLRGRFITTKYGIKPEWYDEQLARQGGHCALCPAVTGWTRTNKSWHSNDQFLLIDHDHESGKVRGLLCAKCNTALHRVEYVTDWAMKALAYLEGSDSHRKAKAVAIDPQAAEA